MLTGFLLLGHISFKVILPYFAPFVFVEVLIYIMNKESLKEHILKKVQLSDEELELFLSYFKEKKVKRKQFIILPGSIAKYRSYVVKGAFRAYVIDDEGSEHTIQLGIEDWWISDYNSYILQQPATMFVVALEDSIVLQIDHESEEKLKAACHIYETFFPDHGRKDCRLPSAPGDL